MPVFIYVRLLPAGGLEAVAARPPSKGLPSLGGPAWPRKGKRPQPHCLPPGPPPRTSADRTKQTGLSAVATVSHPAERGLLLGKWPPAFCQGQHWPRVGNQRGCFPRGQPGVGVSGECVELGPEPGSWSATDSLGVYRMNLGCYFKITQVIPKCILLVK